MTSLEIFKAWLEVLTQVAELFAGVNPLTMEIDSLIEVINNNPNIPMYIHVRKDDVREFYCAAQRNNPELLELIHSEGITEMFFCVEVFETMEYFYTWNIDDKIEEMKEQIANEYEIMEYKKHIDALSDENNWIPNCRFYKANLEPLNIFDVENLEFAIKKKVKYDYATDTVVGMNYIPLVEYDDIPLDEYYLSKHKTKELGFASSLSEAIEIIVAWFKQEATEELRWKGVDVTLRD